MGGLGVFGGPAVSAGAAGSAVRALTPDDGATENPLDDRLTDLPDYRQIAAKSSLGRAAEEDLLRALPPTTVEAGSFLDDLLGPAQP